MAGLGPRQPHPPPANPTVARISPMVPEVSLFFGNSGTSRDFDMYSRPNQKTDTNYQDTYGARVTGPSPFLFQSNNSSGAMRPLDPPSPHKPLLQGLQRPTTDFSRIFDNSGNLSNYGFREKESEYTEPWKIGFPDFVDPVRSRSSPSLQNYDTKTSNEKEFARPAMKTSTENGPYNKTLDLATDPASSPVHPDILKLLTWQNEQLKLLQEQVQVLLQSSPQLKPPGTPKAETQTQTPTQPEVVEEPSPRATRSCSSVSTNTSTLWPEIQEGLERLGKVTKLREEEEEDDSNSSRVTLSEMTRSNIKMTSCEGESTRSPPRTMNIDLPDYAGSDCSPDLRRSEDKVSWESPVLGESVSMYEGRDERLDQEEKEVYNDILTQVNRLLSQPTIEPEKSETENRNPPAAPRSPAQDAATATLNRLRQLGVSFISPEDLSEPCSQEPRSQDYSAMFLPRAACPSQSVWRESPDTSLEISSLALKYLDETQLSRLADKHRMGANKTGLSALVNDSAVNMSMATNEFLNRYGLNSDRNPLQPIDNLSGAQPQRNLKKSSELRREVFRGLRDSGENRNLDRAEPGHKGYSPQFRRGTRTAADPDQGYRQMYQDPSNGRVQGTERPDLRPQQSNGRLSNPMVDGGTPTSSGQRRLPHRLSVPETRALQQPQQFNRVLDITAIKNQTKLL